MSTLRERLNDYLAMRRALGFKFYSEGTGLLAFVDFMEQQQANTIRVDLALAWAKQPTAVQPVRWAQRLSYVRGFARYCRAFDAATEIPHSQLLPFSRRSPMPYPFADEHIETLLKMLCNCRPRMDWPTIPIIVCLAFWSSPVCASAKPKYDPVHAVFQRLTAALPGQPGYRRPRLHDLRHHFAITTLVRWYREGQDVERRLPVLSAFLGHVEVRDTYWYLTARPELLEAAKDRLEGRWGFFS